ncbi:MAG TPA: hypothetical protein GX707_00475 [Epulopiscium sp.]|nr:hypothetical protein [Candidatus Epulonipiscium sp.]
MESLLQDFSQIYTQKIEEEIYKGDETRTIRNPILFVFIGDKSKEALNNIRKEVLEKWQNGEGMLFLQISETVSEQKNNVYSFKVKKPKDNNKQYRHDLYNLFYADSKDLLELNQTIGKIRNQISQLGKLYTTCEKVHICIISQVDDPLNVLVQDISVLLKSKLSEVFKQVTIDFYGLIQEKEEENYSVNCAIAMSFFRELEYMQSYDFSFKANLEILEGGISLEVKEEGAPLFNLTYLLSDKNEKGILANKHMENNHRMIATMNVLKNRYDVKGFDETNNQIYNDVKFKQQLTANENKNTYISMGLGKVQRPNQRIAFTVLLHFYNYIVEKIKNEGIENESLRGELFGYDGISLKKVATQIVPSIEKLEDMQGILSVNMKCNEATKQTFRELENNLYGDVARVFFEDNFQKIAMTQFEEHRKDTALKDLHPFFWAEKDVEKTILLELHSVEKMLAQEMAQLNNELNELYDSRINMHQLSMIPLAEKRNMRKIKRLLFQTIYEKKLEILILQIQINLVKVYEEEIEKIYEKSMEQTAKLSKIKSIIQAAVLSYEKNQDGYLEKNIEEYYQTVVENILLTMEKQRVENFYFDDRFIGNPYSLLDEGEESFISRLIKVCEEYILSDGIFKESFEKELLNRANVTMKYGEKSTVTKQDLFEKLYFTLEEASSINIYTYRYTQKNPYTEKYYFGDYYSDLMQYIFKKGDQGGNVSVGCIYEKRTSGIEVLQIMGGFQIQDLIYGKTCRKYYELYIKEGYLFHGMDTGKLQDITFSNKF